ncbi:MAG: ABC transporter ATP-binding protein [Actinobacteria bacterium]|nr:ABC transporter ATP-binding protein [Actinomycetota bacterium]
MAVSLSLCDITVGTPSGVHAVDRITLSVNAGERMVLLGPSGAGKTTTLRAIAGLVQPVGGDILFNGESMLGVPAERRGVAMVFQDPTLFPYKTVGENVGFGLRIRRVGTAERRERVSEALASVQLPGFEEQWTDEISGGERQRVALARSLVLRPKVLLLDEPLTSLDPSLREELAALICRIQRDWAITTVMVTHDLGEATAVADRIALMMDGRIRQVGFPREFYEEPADAAVARFFATNKAWSPRQNDQHVGTEADPKRMDRT